MGIRANGDLENFMRARLNLKDGNYRYWTTVLEQMLREKKIWGHVQEQWQYWELVPLLRFQFAVTAIVAAMGVALRTTLVRVLNL